MNINNLNPPWHKKKSYGNRLSRDPFYQSTIWKNTKSAFKKGFTKMPDGTNLSNQYCVDCYIENGRMLPGYAIDHIVAIEDGGSRTDHSNLANRCEHHHNKKSAIEGNERRKKK